MMSYIYVALQQKGYPTHLYDKDPNINQTVKDLLRQKLLHIVNNNETAIPPSSLTLKDQRFLQNIQFIKKFTKDNSNIICQADTEGATVIFDYQTKITACFNNIHYFIQEIEELPLTNIK